MWNLTHDLWWSTWRWATLVALLYVVIVVAADIVKRRLADRRERRAVAARYQATVGELESADFSMDRAVSLAEAILENGADDDLWASMAVFPLAAMLCAASGQGNGGGLGGVARMAADFDDPTWGTGIAAGLPQRYQWLGRSVADIDGWAPRQRASLGVVIRRAVGAQMGAVAQ